MKNRISRLLEPAVTIPEDRKIFTNTALKTMILPLFFEQLLEVLVGVADTFMVSYAGEAAVSGVSLVNMFNTVFIFLFSALASGGAVVVSQYIGSRDRKNGCLSASQLVMVSLVFSLGMMLAVLALNRYLLRLLFGEVEPAVMEACETYLRISAYSYPAIALYNAGAAIYRSMGKTSVTMYLSAASNIINIAGNAVGVFVLHAGVAGVAYPSLIARSFAALVILALCFRKKNTVFLRWNQILCWKGSMIRRILGIAVPNGIENGLFQLVKVALSSITALFGTVQIAANGVAQSFWSVAALMGTAMGLAFVTVIGRCMGGGGCEVYHVRQYPFHHLLPGAVFRGLRHLAADGRHRRGLCHVPGLAGKRCHFLVPVSLRRLEKIPGYLKPYRRNAAAFTICEIYFILYPGKIRTSRQGGSVRARGQRTESNYEV